MAGFNENQFRAWERGAPATRQAVSTAFQGVPVGSTPTPLPPETPTLGSAMAQRVPRGVGGGAGGILPEEVAERLYGRTPQPWRAPTATEFMRPRGAEFAYEPPPTGWKAMRAPIPNNVPRFGADLGVRMAAASGPVVGMPPPPPATGAMADLRAVGRPLGAALQKAASVGSAVAPIVNNPLTRTVARFAGPVGLAVGAFGEAYDTQSPFSKHADRAADAYHQGHYGDAVREGWLAAGNVIGAATLVRPVTQGVYGLAKYLTSPHQPAPTAPQAQQAQQAQQSLPGVARSWTPGQDGGGAGQLATLAARQPSVLNTPVYEGDPVDAPPQLRAWLRKNLAPPVKTFDPSQQLIGALTQQADANYIGAVQEAKGDEKKLRKARENRWNELLMLTSAGRGIAPMYYAQHQQQSDD